jgi:serine/threonine protein kinase
MRETYPQLGKYSLLKKLGSGSFAIVKLGEENVFGDQFAIKIFKKSGDPPALNTTHLN